MARSVGGKVIKQKSEAEFTKSFSMPKLTEYEGLYEVLFSKVKEPNYPQTYQGMASSFEMTSEDFLPDIEEMVGYEGYGLKSLPIMMGSPPIPTITATGTLVNS
jgi:hypothetical protein